MSFSTDRDLLALEPRIFNDVPFVVQQRLQVNDGVMSHTTLSSVSADFAEARVEAGCVVLVNDVPHEVLARLDAHTLCVSLLRNTPADATIPSDSGFNMKIQARTFAPQANLVAATLLQLLGLDDADATEAQARIVSLSVMRKLETLGTLWHIYQAAANLVADEPALWQKATQARQRYQGALDTAAIILDLDGDGRGDVCRHLGVAPLTRV